MSTDTRPRGSQWKPHTYPRQTRRGQKQAADSAIAEESGPDPRVALRERADLSGDERDQIAARLARMDARSTHGPWTGETLALIAEKPATLAADLAAEMGRERLPFKADVRKLKELGLTESLEKGYRLSPRGRAFLEGASD